MMFKPFYIHRSHEPGKMNNKHPRGFTALISPLDENYVNIQVAFCSPKDEFRKEEGRRIAALTKQEKFHKRDVPRIISVVNNHCLLKENKEQNWYWVYKYLI